MSEVRTVGRNVDLDRAELVGLGAQQEVRVPEHGAPVVAPAGAPDPDIPTYYGLPALKAPNWLWYVPAYLYLGGAAGAGAVLGGIAWVDPELRPLARRARWLALGGIGVGTVLLVADMGRPSRFLYMLRVFRPTSAINMGSWLLATCGTASAASVLLPDRLADRASVVAAVSGTLVATYTGALLSMTAVPLWNRGRRSLPFVFAGAATASAACLLLPWAERPREEEVLRRLVVGGFLVDLVAKKALEREVGPSHARDALTTGSCGALWTLSKALGAAALVCAATAPGPRGRLLTAALGTLSAVAGRFAVHEAGKRSAQDPRAAFEPRQR